MISVKNKDSLIPYSEAIEEIIRQVEFAMAQTGESFNVEVKETIPHIWNDCANVAGGDIFQPLGYDCFEHEREHWSGSFGCCTEISKGSPKTVGVWAGDETIVEFEELREKIIAEGFPQNFIEHIHTTHWNPKKLRSLLNKFAHAQAAFDERVQQYIEDYDDFDLIF